jgi:TonB family protein
MRIFLLGILLCASLNGQETTAADNSIIAKLDATITSRGVLQATVLVLASGSMRAAYRAAFPPDTAGVPSPQLFGRFLQIRQTESTPIVTGLSEQPVQIRFRILEDGFLLPIHRTESLQLDMVPMGAPFLHTPDVGLPPLVPGRFREEISLEIPADFTIRAGPPVKENRPYAQYRSEAKVEGGRLLVVRELVLQPQAIAGLALTEKESFGKIIRADQEKQFILRRIKRTDPQEFIQSVPVFQANHYGYIAQQQQEYDAARQLFQRAIQAQPDDASAWNNLGRALAALGDLDGAQKAYEKQISINPGDRYSYNNLGLVQERQGRWDAATESIRKQLEINPGDSSATSNLPSALMHAHRWAEAEVAASRALAAQPASAQQRLNVSVIRVCEGKVADPGREISDALGPRPTAPLLNNAAYYLTECGKENKLAESYIGKALDLALASPEPAGGRTMSSAFTHQSTISTYLDTYGWLLYKQNDVARAINLLSAAVALAPRAELYAHLAQAQSKSGHADLEAAYWREATFLEPGRMSEVPAGIVPQLNTLPTLSLDPFWYPLSGGSLAAVGDVLPKGQPSYFFVMADTAGQVTSARELDTEDEPARKILPAVRAVPFPVVQFDGHPMPTVELVKVLKDSDGKILATRSVGTEAVAIARELAPAEFPSTTANPAPTSAAINKSGITPPRLLEKIDPRYSEEARKAFLAGVVVLQSVIGSDGVPRNFKVIKSMGLGLDESAIRAVSAWKFAPALKDGAPIAAVSTMEVIFKLMGNDAKLPKWHLGGVRFGEAPGATRPIITISVPPRAASDAGKATATVEFDIDELGNPIHPQIKENSDEGWAKAVVEALNKWKFTPAQRDGTPIQVRCALDFVRGN